MVQRDGSTFYDYHDYVTGGGGSGGGSINILYNISDYSGNLTTTGGIGGASSWRAPGGNGGAGSISMMRIDNIIE